MTLAILIGAPQSCSALVTLCEGNASIRWSSGLAESASSEARQRP